MQFNYFNLLYLGVDLTSSWGVRGHAPPGRLFLNVEVKCINLEHFEHNMNWWILGVGGSIPKYRYFRYYVTFQNIDTRANRIDTFFSLSISSKTMCRRTQVYALFFSLSTAVLHSSRLAHAQRAPFLSADYQADRQQPATRECDTHAHDGWEKEERCVELIHNCQWKLSELWWVQEGSSLLWPLCIVIVHVCTLHLQK